MCLDILLKSNYSFFFRISYIAILHILRKTIASILAIWQSSTSQSMCHLENQVQFTHEKATLVAENMHNRKIKITTQNQFKTISLILKQQKTSSFILSILRLNVNE